MSPEDSAPRPNEDAQDAGTAPAARLDDLSPGAWRDDLLAAAMFLTRLPVRWSRPWPDGLMLRSMRVWPVIGAGLGLAAGALAAGAAALGLPGMLAGIVGIALLVLVTGGLHEDGLADLADGLGGGRDRDAKLAIMRDSRIGSYGVLALVLGMGARVAALGALAMAGWAPALGAAVAAGAVSRGVLPVLLRRLPPARPDGLGRGAGRPPASIEAVTLLLAAAIAVVAGGLGLSPLAVALALPVAVVAAGAVAAMARRQLGGQTGDVLGAAQQAVEIAMLTACAALVS